MLKNRMLKLFQHNVTFYNVSYGFLLHIWMNIVGKHEYFVPKGRIGTDFVVTHSLIHFLSRSVGPFPTPTYRSIWVDLDVPI